MFQTKQQVDQHVRVVQAHLRSDKDRNLRGLNFSQLYFKVGEYELSRRYISDYLTVNDKSALAFKQLGLCLDALGQKEKAFSAYKTSLDLEPKQPELLLKVCDILLQGEVVLDPSRTKYWCELAETQFPSNNTVFRLKEKMVEAQDSNPSEIKELILKELSLKPDDSFLKVRYLQHLLQLNLISDAFDYAQEQELKIINTLNDNIKWYETCSEILQKYKLDIVQSKVSNWKYWLFNITVLEKQVTLALSDVHNYQRSLVDCANALVDLDQALNEASKCASTMCEERELSTNLIVHFQGQLCLHMATFLFKKAKKDHNLWKETVKHCAPLLLLAFHFAPPDLHDNWLSYTSENNRQIIQRWNRDGSYRCSQAGHIILSCVTEKKVIFMDRISNYCSGVWREKLYKIAFSKIDHINKITSSCFVNSENFKEPNLTFPSLTQLKIYDSISQRQYPNSLHHLVWIGLAYQKKLWEMRCNNFEGLQFSINNLANCNAECLNQLDMETFMYCTVMCTELLQEKYIKSGFISSEKPSVLPANITEPLCSEQQSKWWTAAYKLYKNDDQSSVSDLRIILTRGIEVVRCVGQHGLDAKLLCNLAKIFNERIKNAPESEKHFLEARIGLFYSSAYPLLQRLKSNQIICPLQNRLFNYNHRDLQMNEILHLIEEIKMFQGTQLMNDGDHEKALETFHGMKNPYASFQQGLIYKKLAEAQISSTKENLTSEMRSKHIIMLSKARDCFHLTLDRLRENKLSSHPLDEILALHMEEVEKQLSRIDPDTCANRNDCELLSEDNISSVGSLGENILLNLNNSCINNSVNQIISTPKHKNKNISQYILSTSNYDIKRTESRPSPERLDAQIRNLTIKREHDMNSLMETIHLLVDEIKELKCTVDQESQNHKKLIEDLKNDMSELKKTVGKTKVTPTSNLDDQDFRYLLEDELQNQEYSLPNLYHNYQQQRLPQNPNMNYPTHMYQNPVYSMYPPYGTVPFMENQQVTELRNQVINQQFMYNQAMLNKMNQPDSVTMLQAMNALYPQNASQDLNNFMHNKTDMAFTDHPAGCVAQAPLQPVQQISQSNTNNIVSTSASMQASKSQNFKSAPANVVISNSDPLPAHATTALQSTLSVTIPAHHIKTTTAQSKNIHNYQIAMPNVTPTSAVYGIPNTVDLTKQTSEISKSFLTSSPFDMSTSSTSKTISKVNSTIDSSFGTPTAVSKTNKNIMSEVSASSFYSTADNSEVHNISLNTVVPTPLNQSSDTSLIDKYDPLPDFKPIIPLPDEVEIKTGEEDEEVIFKARSKLYRFIDKEWKERGIGEIKLLSNKITKKVRVLMRRDHTHKICANHIITHDMNLTPSKNETKAYVWHASDFADENVVHEKLCARFKTEELAKLFYAAFEKARKSCRPLHDDKQSAVTSTTIESDSCLVSKDKTANNAENPNKVNLGGFIFTSTPTLKENFKNSNSKVVSAQDTKKETISPFAAFSFGSIMNKSIENSKPIEDKNLKKIEDKMILKTEPNKCNDSKLNISSDEVEEFVPTAEFTPVISLPEKVNEHTGEEHENVLFEERAKLLRFDSECKEWKERGLGNMKILVDKNDDHKVRLLMRREIVLKVCCNHFITKDIEFNRKQTEKMNSVTWSANDFSENEMRPEVFAIKFKTKELCDKFYTTILNAQNKLEQKDSGKHSDQSFSVIKQEGGFGDKFKPKPNSWTCKSCYVTNDKDIYCIACKAPKDNTVTAKKDDIFNSKTEISTFSFGMPNVTNSTQMKEGSTSCYKTESTNFSFGISTNKSNQVVTIDQPKKDEILDCKSQSYMQKTDTGFGDKFKPKPNSWSCKNCYVVNAEELHCLACNSPKDETVLNKDNTLGSKKESSMFSFGMPVTSQPASLAFGKILTSDSARFSFGVPKSTTDHVQENTASNVFKFTLPTANNSTSFVFGATNLNSTDFNKVPDNPIKSLTTASGKFEFVFSPKSPKTKSPSKNVSVTEIDSAGEEEYVSDTEDNIYFTPVIPLPEKVDVITGEENEETLYSHRAKLFRFIDHEWKERGLGDVKILRNFETKRIRILMRRSQILKICLNHMLTSDIEYLPKDEKTWLFTANDFSEEKFELQQFCIRFKSVEIAKNFKKAIDEAKFLLDKDKLEETPDVVDDSDIEITFETKVTEEEKQLARKYLLPDNFYAYKYLDDCKGCRGCRSDDPDLFGKVSSKNLKPNSLFAQENTSKVELSTTEMTCTDNSNINQSIFAENNANINNKPKTFSFLQAQSELHKCSDQTKSPIQNIFSSNASETQINSLFTFKADNTNENKSDISKKSSQLFRHNIFGSNITNQTSEIAAADNNMKTSVQSGQSIFGGSKPLYSFTSSDQDKKDNNLIKHSQLTQSNFTANKTILDKKDLDNPSVISKSTFGCNLSNVNDPEVDKDADKISHHFGQSIFGVTSSELKCKELAENIFNTNLTDKNINKSIFGVTEKTPQSRIEIKEDEPMFKTDSCLSFANLASSTTNPKPFTQAGSNFSWAGAGTPVFGCVQKANASMNKTSSIKDKSEDENQDDSTVLDEEYDPHFEPIIDLPDAIVVTTGEEDETRMYCQRAKLFRYDIASKEWKERGIGDLKILHHPSRNTYRLLLRREQVHKLVLNQLLTKEFTLKSLNLSDRAWCWAGINHAEQPGTGEELAVRFKNAEMAIEFKNLIDSVVKKLKDASKEDIHSDDEYNINNDENVDEYEDDDEDEERSMMFDRNAILMCSGANLKQFSEVGKGELQIVYDSDLFGARIKFYSYDGECLSNTIIAINTRMTISQTECTWSGLDYYLDKPQLRTLKACFDSIDDAEDFLNTFKEGVSFAQEADIMDPVHE